MSKSRTRKNIEKEIQTIKKKIGENDALILELEAKRDELIRQQSGDSTPKARIDDQVYCKACERGVGCPDWDPPDGWCTAGIQSSEVKPE